MQSRRLIAVIMMTLSAAVLAEGIRVDMVGERIVIESEQQSLTAVFERVGEVTGANVQISEQVEQPVSLSVRERPLQQAMDAIARQYSLNIVLGWQRDSSGQSTLVSIDVLPDGTMDPDALAREDDRRERMLSQQQKKRPGRAIPGGAEDKSWWNNRGKSAQPQGEAP